MPICGLSMFSSRFQSLLQTTSRSTSATDYGLPQRGRSRNWPLRIEYAQERVSSIVRFGSVASEVLAEADDWPADLIALGSHRPGIAAYLLGSHAAAIVRHAQCSVLVIRSATADKPSTAP